MRYADDVNVYIGSARAGHRVMESVTHFITLPPQAQGQSGQERGGTAAGAAVSGIQLHRRPPAEAAHRAQGRAAVSEAGPAADAAESRGQSHAYGGAAGVLPVRVARLLRLLRDLDGTPGPGLVDTSAAPLRHLEAVESLSPPSAGTDDSGLDRKLASMTAFRSQGPWRLSQSKAMHVAFPKAYFDSLGLPRLDTR